MKKSRGTMTNPRFRRLRKSSSVLACFCALVAVLLLLQTPTSHAFAPPQAPSRSTYSTIQLHGWQDVLVGGGVVVAGLAGWLYVDGTDDRQRRDLRQQEEELYQKYQQERASKAYIEPREYWKEEELAQYDGSQDEDGPILMAADGLVFNVWKGRNFYGPGGEYHLFAGKDATRFLAKTSVEEETPEQAAKPLNMAERAALAGWMFTIKNKYEVVGKLEGFDPSTTSMKSL